MCELFREKFHNDWVISLETSEEEAKSDCSGLGNVHNYNMKYSIRILNFKKNIVNKQLASHNLCY